MRETTYLLYVIFWEGFVWGGWAYIVFGLGASGWWTVLALLLSASAYSPERFIHGKRE